jgi:hypothetical protein
MTGSGEEIAAAAGEGFSWGINNKGFIGAFLAARRFYDTKEVTEEYPSRTQI